MKPNAKRLERSAALVAYDHGYPAFGESLAGMDEAGRGPLLGCVVAACVIMPAEPIFPWIDDSKKLSAARREELFEQIYESAIYVGVGRVSAAEIDRLNILRATRIAMQRAAENAPATLCLVDAVTGLELPFSTQPLLHGDATSYSIAAASIIAKVTRDREIRALAEQYPQYGLEHNMGYGTAEHIAAIRLYGPCDEHRRTFIGNFLEG